ncbi:exo-beta-N-acetylmuramidase NamZ family protein [Actinoallomurus acanthiterrae]
MRVSPGIERLLDGEVSSQVKGAAIGLLASAASVTPGLRHDLDALLAAGFQIVSVFGPEHGFRSTAQAAESESSTVDADTGIPVVDTYQREPAEIAERVRAAGVELLLIDLQDVGARFYTYVWSMYDLLVAAGLAGVPVLVLDRPNPVGGDIVAGPMLAAEFASFVGRAPVPLRHGMTIGELARLFADLIGDVRVEVAPMRGWRREMRFGDTGLVWVPPSPNIPTALTAECYSGTGLIEGTNLSEGRGTTTPFEVLGAPWLDARLARSIAALEPPGAAVRQTTFVPAFSKHSGTPVHGLHLHVTDPRRFDPVHTAVAILTTVRRRWPDDFAWRTPFCDKLAGSAALRESIDAGADTADITASWEDPLNAFRALRERYLLYAPGR